MLSGLADDQEKPYRPSKILKKRPDPFSFAITMNDDLLTLADIFLNTPYRRLPVVQDGKLMGQVSRRDVLHCAYHLMDPKAERTSRFHISAG